MKMKSQLFAEPSSSWRVMRWHRFAPEENNKENGNDTNCLCNGGGNVAHVCRFGHLASRADCTTHWRDFQ